MKRSLQKVWNVISTIIVAIVVILALDVYKRQGQHNVSSRSCDSLGVVEVIGKSVGSLVVNEVLCVAQHLVGLSHVIRNRCV